MTRRLALVILSVVVTTLVLAGLGTLVLTSVHARRQTVDDVRTYAAQIAANLDQLLEIEAEPGTILAAQQARLRARALKVVRSVIDVDDLVIITTGADGVPVTDGVLAADPLPSLLTPADLPRLDTTVVAGHRDGAAFAIAPVEGLLGRRWYVIVTRDLPTVAAEGLTIFFSAAGATLVIGLFASWALGRHLARPLDEASAAATRIAGGDLSVRLPTPGSNQRDELAVLARSVNDMADSLERSRALEQQFLLSVSHDLRTPLTSIGGYAEAIADGTGDPVASATVIRSEAHRLERLVADLLDLAKLQASAFRLEPREVDLGTVACTAVETAALLRPAIDVRLSVPTPVAVNADPDRLTQVLVNLLENAVRFAGSVVLVTVQVDDTVATVTVDDDGPGIAAEDLPHVFERLYVARRTPERRENSSGLGLAIARELVTAMGGTVSAGIAPSGGARLSVRLPTIDR